MFGFGGPKFIKKKCSYCGEEYEAPEFEEMMFTHLSWCIPYRTRQIKEKMAWDAQIKKMEDDHQKRLIREVLVEAGVIKPV